MALSLAAYRARSNTLTSKGIRDIALKAGAVSMMGVGGIASHKAANGVTTHTASAPGAYCCFSTNSGVKLDSAIEARTGWAVRLRRMSSLSPGRAGEITRVLDSRGGGESFAQPGASREAARAFL